MEQELMQMLTGNGPFAVLFVWLLFYVIRNNKEREIRLQELLDKFSEKYDVIIAEIRDIKERVGGDRK